MPMHQVHATKPKCAAIAPEILSFRLLESIRVKSMHELLDMANGESELTPEKEGRKGQRQDIVIALCFFCLPSL